MGVAFGPPGGGKTFMSLDLSLSIATGRPWMGKETEKRTVVYIASEGGRRSAANRIIGWRREHGVTDTSNFECLPANFTLSKGAADFLKALAARGVRPGFVVIDTLNQNLGGGDENSSQDMGSFVAAVKSIQREFGCFVLVVHHSGKDQTRGSRGHSSLLGAVDLEVEIAGNIFEITKSRDGPDGEKIGFELKQITLGQSPKGRNVTTCVALSSTAPVAEAARAKALTNKSDTQKMALKVLERCVSASQDFGGKLPTFDEWKNEVKKEISQGPDGEDIDTRNLGTSIKRLCKGPNPLVRINPDGFVEPMYPPPGGI